MDELGATLQYLVADAMSEDSAADAVAGFEDKDVQARLCEGTGGSETGDSCANDQDVWWIL